MTGLESDAAPGSRPGKVPIGGDGGVLFVAICAEAAGSWSRLGNQIAAAAARMDEASAGREFAEIYSQSALALAARLLAAIAMHQDGRGGVLDREKMAGVVEAYHGLVVAEVAWKACRNILAAELTPVGHA